MIVTEIQTDDFGKVLVENEEILSIILETLCEKGIYFTTTKVMIHTDTR